MSDTSARGHVQASTGRPEAITSLPSPFHAHIFFQKEALEKRTLTTLSKVPNYPLGAQLSAPRGNFAAAVVASSEKWSRRCVSAAPLSVRAASRAHGPPTIALIEAEELLKTRRGGGGWNPQRERAVRAPEAQLLKNTFEVFRCGRLSVRSTYKQTEIPRK